MSDRTSPPNAMGRVSKYVISGKLSANLSQSFDICFFVGDIVGFLSYIQSNRRTYQRVLGELRQFF